MGEIFERPAPKVSLAFTGERLTTDYGGQTEIEHLHRYFLARHLCRDRQVLDIASGEGYGSALLAQVAASVVGVEIANDVVAHAAANYKRDNLCYRVGDACAIPLEDASVDVVVSFETLEHLFDQDRFLSEIRRVLRPGGLVVISTPDRDNYSPVDQPANAYHALELTRPEFALLLQRHFSHHAMFWQRPMTGSVIIAGPEASAAPGGLCFERRGDAHFEASQGYVRPRYLLALCSDDTLPEIPPSVYIDAGFLFTRDDHRHIVQGYDHQISALRDQLNHSEGLLVLERAERERLQLEALERDGRLAAEHAEKEQMRLDLIDRDGRLAMERAEKAQMQQDLLDRVERLGVERAERERLHHALSASNALLAGEQSATQALQKELSARDAALALARGEHDRLEQEAATYAASLSRLEAALAATRGSTSWRITAPLRAVVTLLRGPQKQDRLT